MRISATTTSLAVPTQAEVVKLLKNTPVFSNLPTQKLWEIAAEMESITYSPGEIIVVEDAMVDSVYFIFSGRADVSVKTHQDDYFPVATLYAGESIGLGKEGFYYESGIRVATVTAATPLAAVKLSIERLNLFFKKNPNILPSMHSFASELEKIAFIKQLKPFQQLSEEVIKNISSRITEVELTKGVVLFKEGDERDNCYFISSGEIEISQIHDGKNKQIAILKKGGVLGETAILTDSKRNATATLMTDCRLYVLKEQDLKQIVNSSPEVTEDITELLVHRSRPCQIPNVIVHEQNSDDGEKFYILKDEKNNLYFRTAEEGLFIWKLLDGHRTIQDITMEFHKKYNRFVPDDIAEFISLLASAGFLLNVPQKHTVNPDYVAHLSIWGRLIQKLTLVLEAKVSIKNVDNRLAALYNTFGRLFFLKISQIIMLLFAGIGFILFVMLTPRIPALITDPMTFVWLGIGLFPLGLITVFLHELSHALAVKHYGLHVHRMGVGWYWFGPIAFTDTSEMWIAPRNQRYVVSLAGIYCDCVLAGIAITIAWFVSSPLIILYLWIYALGNYTSCLANLDPIVEFDGYFVLMDYFEIPNLREAAVVWLAEILPKTWRDPQQLKQHYREIAYWIICLVFLFISVVITYLLQKYVLMEILPTAISKHEVLWNILIPLLVMVIASLGIWTEVKHRRALVGQRG